MVFQNFQRRHYLLLAGSLQDHGINHLPDLWVYKPLRREAVWGEAPFWGGGTFSEVRAWICNREVELNMQFYFHFHSVPRRKHREIDCTCINKSAHKWPLQHAARGIEQFFLYSAVMDPSQGRVLVQSPKLAHFSELKRATDPQRRSVGGWLSQLSCYNKMPQAGG